MTAVPKQRIPLHEIVPLGGIFALVFAAVQGRIGRARPRVTAATLALAGFLVPFT
jgi:hypothetical protein